MNAKYDTIGRTYNSTRAADPYLTGRMFELLKAENGPVLDLGCGTGNYTCALAELGLSLIGVDPSEIMLEKARAGNSSIHWMRGTAEQIPLADNSVQSVLASLTTHHWSDIPAGCREVARVLKPEGHFVVFTSTPEQMDGYWIGHYFPEAFRKSQEQMPLRQGTIDAIEAAGMIMVKEETYDVRPDLQDLFLLSGKHNPELYFDPVVRAGISTFSSLCDDDELHKGLKQLRDDIDSGRVADIMTAKKSETGDYLFIQAKLP